MTGRAPTRAAAADRRCVGSLGGAGRSPALSATCSEGGPSLVRHPRRRLAAKDPPRCDLRAWFQPERPMSERRLTNQVGHVAVVVRTASRAVPETQSESLWRERETAFAAPGSSRLAAVIARELE